jgi:hypothetical protein
VNARPNDNDAPAAADPGERSPAFDAGAHHEDSLVGWEAAAAG